MGLLSGTKHTAVALETIPRLKIAKGDIVSINTLEWSKPQNFVLKTEGQNQGWWFLDSDKFQVINPEFLNAA